MLISLNYLSFSILHYWHAAFNKFESRINAVEKIVIWYSAFNRFWIEKLFLLSKSLFFFWWSCIVKEWCAWCFKPFSRCFAEVDWIMLMYLDRLLYVCGYLFTLIFRMKSTMFVYIRIAMETQFCFIMRVVLRLETLTRRFAIINYYWLSSIFVADLSSPILQLPYLYYLLLAQWWKAGCRKRVSQNQKFMSNWCLKIIDEYQLAVLSITVDVFIHERKNK